ncbi:MAG: chromosomal replication initiator protein DnaA [Isosphaeraceae bacterium]
MTALAKQLGESRFRLWFGEGVNLVLRGDGDALEVQVPNTFFREWIQGHFSGSLIEAAASVTGRRVQLTFSIRDQDCCAPDSAVGTGHHLEGSPEQVSDAISLSHPVNPAGRELRALAQSQGFGIKSGLRPAHPPTIFQPRRKLEHLLVGPANQLAYAAAREMIRTAGSMFNPLLIHGSIGVGKTALLEAIAHGLRTSHPGLNVLWITAEAFTNSFLEAMRAGALASFRSRYRGAGALAMDDAHFLAGTRATQSEFLHTFDTLFERSAPIILTARQHPRQITRLTEELVTRFGGGMVVKLESPDQETRRAILDLACKAKGVTVPAPVLDYIAENIRSSIRELEGALNIVIAHMTLSGRQLDLALARKALHDVIRHVSSSVGLLEVEKAVCQLFKIDPDVLKSESRARAIAHPRMLAMYLARKYTEASYGTIGEHFGGRNHATVMAAQKKIERWLREEEECKLLPGFNTIAELIADLEKSLGV